MTDVTAASVLAVLVVYERNIDQAEAWPALMQMLAASELSSPDSALRLAHVLIYDNSKSPRARPAYPLTQCTYIHDAENGGTAAAYRHAAKLGASLGVIWLLLLDHDTSLPPTLLQSASSALVKSIPHEPSALLPWVMHDELVVSPGRVTIAGTVRPLVRGVQLEADWQLTGIASGSFVRLDEFDALDRMPRGLWLDYVDHWIFAMLALRGGSVALIDCVLQHDLSVTHLDRLSAARLQSILSAESMFVATLPWPARAVHPVRLLARAMRVARAQPSHARSILTHAVQRRHEARATACVSIRAVSVVMAVYNGERFLAAQVASVMAELHPDDELLVIDDASTDDSTRWLAQINDSRVRIVRHVENIGVRRSFEEGLRRARHKVIFLCDQDDIWLPGKREAVVAEFERNPRAMIVLSDAEVIDSEDHILAKSFMATRGGFKGSVWHTLVRNRYLGCAMAVRQELIEAALPIPATAPMHDMWLGAIGGVLGPVCYIDRPLIRYRRHGGNVSPSRSQSWSRMLRWRSALLFAAMKRVTSIALGLHRPHQVGEADWLP